MAVPVMTDPRSTVHRWGALWRSCNRLGGPHSHFLWIDAERPANFRTRAEARAWIKSRYGYIRTRPDLQREPHGWKMPKAVRMTITLQLQDGSW